MGWTQSYNKNPFTVTIYFKNYVHKRPQANANHKYVTNVNERFRSGNVQNNKKPLHVIIQICQLDV
jgi:hypothetical protein